MVKVIRCRQFGIECFLGVILTQLRWQDNAYRKNNRFEDKWEGKAELVSSVLEM